VLSGNQQLEVIVGQRFGVFAVEVSEGNSSDFTPNERLHELALLSRGQFTQYAVSLARDLDWNLIRHPG